MTSKPKPQEIELLPDAWGKFERAVDVVVKSPPQPRTKAKSKQRKRVAKRRASAPKSV